MSAEFRLDLPKILTRGPADLVREWNKMVECQRVLERAIRARTLRPSPGLDIAVSPAGQRVILRNRAKPKAPPCALGRVFTSGASTYLSAGVISAAGTHTDVGGTSGTALTPTIGDVVWAEVTITATVDDGVLTGAWSAASAAIDQGASVPSDHSWTDSSATGNAYAPLGTWISDGADTPSPVWSSYGCGNVVFSFCIQADNSGAAFYYRA